MDAPRGRQQVRRECPRTLRETYRDSYVIIGSILLAYQPVGAQDLLLGRQQAAAFVTLQ